MIRLQCFCFGSRSYYEHKLIVVKQFTDIPIYLGPFKERTKTGRFQFYRTGISAICHHLFNASESLVFQKNSNRNRSYFNLHENFQKRKLIIFFFFPPLVVLSIILFTPGHPKMPFNTKDALNTVRKSFILVYMTNYYEVITFLICIVVYHRRTCKFYCSH